MPVSEALNSLIEWGNPCNSSLRRQWPIRTIKNNNAAGPIIVIPALTASGVLPPFISGYPKHGPDSMAPYEATMLEVATRFCTSPERIELFKGLLLLRSELHALGVTIGTQWLNGSFCEDVETTRGRPPEDIDVVTLLVRPQAVRDDSSWAKFWQANTRVFDSKSAKTIFGCEAFYVDAGYPALVVAEQVTYWFGLFTHQRVSHLWKGIVEVPLVADDKDARDFVETLRF